MSLHSLKITYNWDTLLILIALTNTTHYFKSYLLCTCGFFVRFRSFKIWIIARIFVMMFALCFLILLRLITALKLCYVNLPKFQWKTTEFPIDNLFRIHEFNVIYTDLSKTFDNVYRPLLLNTLKKISLTVQ